MKKLCTLLLAIVTMSQTLGITPIEAAEMNWTRKGDTWYAMNNSGNTIKGWYKDQYNCWYMLDWSTGAMKTGWVASGPNWYYMNPANGIMQTGWKQINNKWYFLDNTGAMLEETTYMGYELKKGGYGVLLNNSGSYSLGRSEKNKEYVNVENNMYTKEFTGSKLELKAVDIYGKLVVEGNVKEINLIDCDIDEILIKNKTGELKINISKDSSIGIVTIPKEAKIDIDKKLKDIEYYNSQQYKIANGKSLNVELAYNTNTNKDKNKDKRREEIIETVEEVVTPNKGETVDIKKAYNHDKANSSLITKGTLKVNSETDFTTKYINGGVAITRYRGRSKEVVIPATINGYNVVEIYDGAFEDCDLTKVVLPSTVKVIGDEAFKNNKLSDIYFPENLESIGESAFRNNKIKQLTTNNELEYIGEYAFYGNKPLTTLNIKGSLKTIGDYAFANASIKAFKGNDELEVIGAGAFSNNLITNCTLGNNLIEVGNSAFKNNSIGKLDIPSTVEIIGSEAFSGNSIKNIIVGENVYSIGSEAFYVNVSSGSNDVLSTVKNMSRNDFDWNDIFFGRSGRDTETGIFKYGEKGKITVSDYKGNAPKEVIEEEVKKYTVTLVYGYNLKKTVIVENGKEVDTYGLDLDKPGYKFIGWDKPLTGINKNQTINAKYEVDPNYEKYTVYFMTNALGEPNDPNSILYKVEIPKGTKIRDINDTSKYRPNELEGYDVAWDFSGYSGTLQDDITIFPVYTAKRYKCSIILVDNKVEVLYFTYGEPMTALGQLDIDNQEGYTFDGFYIDGVEVTEDTTFEWKTDISIQTRYTAK